MAANILPSGIGDLFQLAERIENGLAKYAAWLFKAPAQAEEFSELLKCTRAAERTFLIARVEKATAGRCFAEADAALTAWLAKARLVVMLAYGNKWSESWMAAGFTHRGTNVPKRIGPRMTLSRSLADFLADHPEYEVPFAGVTAAEGGRLQKAIATAEKPCALPSRKSRRKSGRAMQPKGNCVMRCISWSSISAM